VSGLVSVSFEENEILICEKIKASNAVVGCAPWLTSHNIISALATLKHGASLVLDKQSMHRYLYKENNDLSELSYSFNSIKPLRFRVKNIPVDFPGMYNINTDFINEDAIRVFGQSSLNNSVKSLLHYKFMVFCDVIVNNDKDDEILPKSVICGSYNFSQNAQNCRETVILIDNPTIASNFFDEWAQAYLLSEQRQKYGEEMNPTFLIASSAREIVRNLNDEYFAEHLQELAEGKEHWEGAFYEKDCYYWSEN